MSRKTYQQFCPLALALDHVGERWTLLLVRELLSGPKRFVQLRDALPGLATNLLTDRLRSMVADGVVERVELPPPAMVAVYQLTSLGTELEDVVMALARWGRHWMAERRPDQQTDHAWIVLALRALLDPQAWARMRLCVALHVDGHLVTMDFSRDGVTVDSSPRASDLTIGCSASVAIGIVSGALSIGQAVARREAFVYGQDEVVAQFEQALVASRRV